MWLDIVVIGKNEEQNLSKLKLSISKLGEIVNKTIYVDAASEDDSVQMAHSFCEVVVVLKKSEGNCASLGRRVGATYTEKDWVLFLDADMEIHEQFCEWLSTFSNKTKNVGFVGKYMDVDVERKKIKYRTFTHRDGIARYFGGAVLLKRDALLQSGNWSNSIYSNEEIELYARMSRLNLKVEIIEEVMVNHYTEILPTKEKVLELFLWKRKTKMGPSQVFVKSIREGFFRYLLYLQPLPYILFVVNILTLILFSLTSVRVALYWFIITHILVIIINKNLKSIILAYIFQYSIIVGLLLQVPLVKRRL